MSTMIRKSNMIDHGRLKFDGPFNMNLGHLTRQNMGEHVLTKVKSKFNKDDHVILNHDRPRFDHG